MERTKINFIIDRFMHGDRQGFTDVQILEIYSKYLESRKAVK